VVRTIFDLGRGAVTFTSKSYITEFESRRFKSECESSFSSPCPSTDNIVKSMTAWRITGKISRTTFTVTYAYS